MFSLAFVNLFICFCGQLDAGNSHDCLASRFMYFPLLPALSLRFVATLLQLSVSWPLLSSLAYWLVNHFCSLLSHLSTWLHFNYSLVFLLSLSSTILRIPSLAITFGFLLVTLLGPTLTSSLASFIASFSPFSLAYSPASWLASSLYICPASFLSFLTLSLQSLFPCFAYSAISSITFSVD